MWLKKSNNQPQTNSPCSSNSNYYYTPKEFPTHYCHEHATRALKVAASRSHNVPMNGPPVCGGMISRGNPRIHTAYSKTQEFIL